MVYTKQDDKIIFKGDSDAHIVKGLVSIILMIFSGKTPKDIIDLDAREILTGPWSVATFIAHAHQRAFFNG